MIICVELEVSKGLDHNFTMFFFQLKFLRMGGEGSDCFKIEKHE